MHWTGYPAEKINPLTGARVTETIYMCDDLWNTKIAFDAAGFADKAGAALDSLRNEVTRRQDKLEAIVQFGAAQAIEEKHASLPRQ